MAEIPENGQLAATPLPRLLLGLHGARFNGRLTLSRDRVRKSFLFRDGLPIFAESNLASESLGVQLMDEGRLSREDYSSLVSHVQRHQCKEGTALLALELIDPKSLFLALKEQVRARIVECFGWTRGQFSSEPGEAPSEEAQPFRANLYSLLQEGIETHWTSEHTLGELRSNMERYPQCTRRFGRIASRLESDAAVEALFEALDGAQPLWRALQAATTPRALAAAWVLDATGVLAYGDGPSGDADARVRVDREIEIVVQGHQEASEAPDAEAASAAGPKRPVASDAQLDALRKGIDEKYARLDELDHYALLGVAPRAKSNNIKRAYLEAAKSYHPDSLARSGFDGETRERASKVFAAIGKAYATLSNPERRKEYDAARADDGSEIDANKVAMAETLYRKGEVLMRQGNFKGALEFLKPAVDLWPEEAVYQSALGWALYKKLPSEAEAGRDHLERARGLQPDDASVLSRLSVVLRDLGEHDEAAAALAKAKRIDPTIA